MSVTHRALIVCGLALASSCGGEPNSTFINPVLTVPCKADQCSVNGVCTTRMGNAVCVCAIGYAGAGCDRCEDGFHRDSRDRCVTDQSCAEQAEDPCAPNGQCADGDGVLTCVCEDAYQGPRCNLCADELAWSGRSVCEPVVPDEPDPEPVEDASSNDAGRLDAGGDEPEAGAPDASGPDAGPLDGGTSDAGPVDAGVHDAGTPDTGTLDAGTPDAGTLDAGTLDGGALDGGAPDAQVTDGGSQDAGPKDAGTDACVSHAFSEAFELSAFPDAPNNCAADSSLTVANIAFRSLAGEGTVQRCGPSTFNGINSHFVELEAGPTRDAQLTLTHATSAISFKLGATIQPLALDVFGDGRLLQSVAVPALSNTSFSFTPIPAVTTVSFRSRTLYIQHLGIDDITYTTLSCN